MPGTHETAESIFAASFLLIIQTISQQYIVMEFHVFNLSYTPKKSEMQSIQISQAIN